MKISKQWSNWKVFGISFILSLVLAIAFYSLYLNSFLDSGGGYWIGGEVLDVLDAYINSFFFLYTILITFFYKGFSKNFKPKNLIYFLALPFLLYISSPKHFLVFMGLFATGLLLEKLFRKRSQTK